MDNTVNEAIAIEADLLTKLRPLPEADIFKFMDALKGGTYFNMGMYSSIPAARGYKKSLRIYKVVDLAAIVSGVNYENIKTTKDFRDATGTTPNSAAKKSWYDHVKGYENKVGEKSSNPEDKYVLWDVKKGTNTVVRYYIVDIATGDVTAVSKADILASDYITPTEKAKLQPKPVEGFNKQTGELVLNQTVWRTAAFEHIFWLSQSDREYGTRFIEALNLKEDTGSKNLFIDGNSECKLGTVDAILSGKAAGVEQDVVEELEDDIESNEDLEALQEEVLEESDLFMDGNADAPRGTVDKVLSGKVEKDNRYTPLVDNDLFVDFE